MQLLQINKILSVVILVGVVLLPSFAYADTSNIIPAHKYAWSDVGGYVNFAPTKSPVYVSDSGLTGYAWSANDGWINLNPMYGGITNHNGALGGFAWDESVGWISFAGVTIDSSGRFHGIAKGANASINFDCSNCDVQTTWTPYSAKSGAISPILGSYGDSNPLPGHKVLHYKSEQESSIKPLPETSSTTKVFVISSTTVASKTSEWGGGTDIVSSAESAVASVGATQSPVASTKQPTVLEILILISTVALLFLLFLVTRLFKTQGEVLE